MHVNCLQLLKKKHLLKTIRLFLNAISALGLKSVVKRRGSARVPETTAATGRERPVKVGAHRLATLVASVAAEALVDERGGANSIRVVLVTVQVLQRELVIPRREPSSDRTVLIAVMSTMMMNVGCKTLDVRIFENLIV